MTSASKYLAWRFSAVATFAFCLLLQFTMNSRCRWKHFERKSCPKCSPKASCGRIGSTPGGNGVYRTSNQKNDKVSEIIGISNV
jgi:hypothetical protein